MVLQTKFANIKENNLYIDDVNACDLAKKYGTPLYVMSEGHIRNQFNTLKTKMIDKYENTLPLFASKSFSCKAIYQLAMEYGVGIDCVSAGEISVALKGGFDPKKIYFHGNNKLASEIEYALKNGVENFVIDNFYEIELVQEIAAKLGVMVNGIVRITPGVYAGGHDYIRVGAKDTKFGFSSHDNTYLKAIKKVIDAPNIKFDGIHCHVGSQIEDIQAYILAMNKFVEISCEIYDIFGIVINKLNAGGGFGIAYTKADRPLEFEKVVDTIMDIVTKGFEERNLKRPMVLVEPGRYCVGNAGITLYTVGSYKFIKDIRDYITVDGGMTDNIRSSLYGAKYDALIANKANMPADHLVTVAGKNCESGDILIKDIMLQDPKPGDILAMFSTGAYHYSMSSNYNQLPKPAVVFTYQGKDRLVIRRQTFDDLVAYDVDSTY
ncbi:MAG: diaminopimelate decarboxylase [Thomasclavelia sp.]